MPKKIPWNEFDCPDCGINWTEHPETWTKGLICPECFTSERYKKISDPIKRDRLKRYLELFTVTDTELIAAATALRRKT